MRCHHRGCSKMAAQVTSIMIPVVWGAPNGAQNGPLGANDSRFGAQDGPFGALYGQDRLQTALQGAPEIPPRSAPVTVFSRGTF